jgi:hypothetical protein
MFYFNTIYLVRFFLSKVWPNFILLIIGSPTVIQIYEEVEDTKGVIRIRISNDRQHNDQKKTDKNDKNDLQAIHIKLKIE